MELYCERIGEEGPTLLLLHGLAANGAVWAQAVRELRGKWPGKMIIPDLRGHGRSAHARHYGYGQHAADLADLLKPGEPVSIVGHSMGAVVACALASGWYGVSIEAVFGFSIKVRWRQSEIEKTHALALAPVRWFETRADAADRFLHLSGLSGLVDIDSPVVDAGLRQEIGRWRLACDPGIFSAPGPPFQAVVQLAKTRIRLACGSEDPMVSVEELRALDPEAMMLPGLGHNLHVGAPEAFIDAAVGFLVGGRPRSTV